MIIGIPKESWRDERRVSLTPVGVYSLTKSGHQVIVQVDAGVGSGFSADDYRESGAGVVYSTEEVFARSDLLVKVMPPSLQECRWMQDERFLFSWVQLGVSTSAAHQLLMQKRTTAIGFELIEDQVGNLPVLTAMSEIAGLLLPQLAGRYLETTSGGRGVTLGGVAGVPPSNVVIIGAGIVGSTAARAFCGIGANVTVLDADLGRLRQLVSMPVIRVNTALATLYNISRYVEFADVVVGAVLIHGKKAPHVISEEMVRKMKPGSVIFDVSIDQGGCAETSRPTTLSDPVFVKHGVTHYCVPNFPSLVARTASHALNNVVLSFVEDLAFNELAAIATDAALGRGVYLHAGQCTHADIAALHGCDYVPMAHFLGG